MTPTLRKNLDEIAARLSRQAERALAEGMSPARDGQPVGYVRGAEDGSLTRRFVAHIQADEYTQLAGWLVQDVSLEDTRAMLVERIIQLRPRGGEDPFRAVANSARTDVVVSLLRSL